MNKKPVEKHDGSDKSYENINYFIDKFCCEYIRGYNQCLQEVREYMPSVATLNFIIQKACPDLNLGKVYKIGNAIKDRIDI